MCGIFGIVTQSKDLPVAKLIREGLQRLEYRGYDSAGIVMISDHKLHLKKDAGRINDINAKLHFDEMPGLIGMGHTRWATHGPPIAKNAHPHLDCTGKIAVIHNGILENFQQLRKELSARGHIFKSDTDTEAVSHLVEELIKKGLNLREAALEAIKCCEGAFGLVICAADHPDSIIVARRESPLVIGIDKARGAIYAASDIPAFLPLTRTALILNDNEMAELKPDQVDIYDLLTDKPVKRDSYEVEWSIDAAEKGGYPYFMLKELHEVPAKVKAQIHIPQSDIDAFAKAIIGASHFYITAAGTAYHACLAGKALFARFAKIFVKPILCSEFRDELRDCMKPNSVVIAVSQSGETLDTLEAVRYAREKYNAKVCSVVNVVGSSLTRYSDHVIITTAGPEIAVASQKAYNTQVSALCLIALRIAELQGQMPVDVSQKYREALNGVPAVLEKIRTEHEQKIKKLAEKYAKKPNFYFLARGASVAAAAEGALKFKEISYSHTEAYAAGESKHGPIALIVKDFPVIFVAPPDDTYERLIGNIMEMKARGATIIATVAEYDEKITELATDTIRIPHPKDEYYVNLSPLMYTYPLQIFAYYAAVHNGHDPDKPRNLAKSVTVK
ncbi:MAG: glucosamine-fructose-6-phosphate aminotransferase [Promethearchaeota archaeon CR_4]|nr:MAG: glucosamine-fructose-6-phosphate aminotransferase [Candidatus Lokiarchaeota archaeon CR_4]